MRDQVCRQVQTEMRKTCEKEAPSFARSEEGPESEAWGEQEDARRERRTEPARLYPQRAPDSRKLTQTMHEKNQEELPMRLGVDSKESWRSRTWSPARHRATLARTDTTRGYPVVLDLFRRLVVDFPKC